MVLGCIFFRGSNEILFIILLWLVSVCLVQEDCHSLPMGVSEFTQGMYGVPMFGLVMC